MSYFNEYLMAPNLESIDSQEQGKITTYTHINHDLSWTSIERSDKDDADTGRKWTATAHLSCYLISPNGLSIDN